MSQNTLKTILLGYFIIIVMVKTCINTKKIDLTSNNEPAWKEKGGRKSMERVGVQSFECSSSPNQFHHS